MKEEENEGLNILSFLTPNLIDFQLNAPAMREPTTQPDEFFSDQSDEIRNIFDDVLPDPDA
jgi:hypothetical protein